MSDMNVVTSNPTNQKNPQIYSAGNKKLHENVKVNNHEGTKQVSVKKSKKKY